MVVRGERDGIRGGNGNGNGIGIGIGIGVKGRVGFGRAVV